MTFRFSNRRCGSGLEFLITSQHLSQPPKTLSFRFLVFGLLRYHEVCRGKKGQTNTNLALPHLSPRPRMMQSAVDSTWPPSIVTTRFMPFPMDLAGLRPLHIHAQRRKQTRQMDHPSAQYSNPPEVFLNSPTARRHQLLASKQKRPSCQMQQDGLFCFGETLFTCSVPA